MTIELGPPPRPTDGAELARRIVEQLRKYPDLIENPASARVSVDANAAGVERVDVDLTGVRLRVPPNSDEPPAAEPRLPKGDPDVVGQLTLRGQPLQIEGRQVWLDAAFNDQPFEWIETDQVIAQLLDNSPEHPLTGHLQVEIAAKDLERLVEDAFNVAGQGRIAIANLDIDLTQPGIRQVEAKGAVTVRQKLLAGRVRCSASIDWDENFTVTVRSVRLSTINPLLWIPLIFANRWLVQNQLEPVPLRYPEQGIEVSDLRLDLGQRLRVFASFARS